MLSKIGPVVQQVGKKYETVTLIQSINGPICYHRENSFQAVAAHKALRSIVGLKTTNVSFPCAFAVHVNFFWIKLSFTPIGEILELVTSPDYLIRF